MGWKLALPSWVKLGSSFTKGVLPFLGDGLSALPSRGGGWPFLLVGFGPSFSGWELPFSIAVGVGTSSGLALPFLGRGWPFLQGAGAPFRRGGKSSLWR